MKTWSIIFTSVVAGIIVAAGMLFVVRGQIQKWEQAETEAIRLIDEAILQSRRDIAEHGASRVFMSVQRAGFTLTNAPLWADEEPLRKKCMEGAELVNRYRASLGLPPYTLLDMWGQG